MGSTYIDGPNPPGGWRSTPEPVPVPAHLLYDSTDDDGDGCLWTDGEGGGALTPPIPDELGRELARRWNLHAEMLAALGAMVERFECHNPGGTPV